jgi:hypothetical protein
MIQVILLQLHSHSPFEVQLYPMAVPDGTTGSLSGQCGALVRLPADLSAKSFFPPPDNIQFETQAVHFLLNAPCQIRNDHFRQITEVSRTFRFQIIKPL